MAKTRKKIKKCNKKCKKKHTFKRGDYKSGDGMLTSVWGPPLWHFLHAMSFNYPVKPSKKQKKAYRTFILQLRNILPCRYCRENLKKNLKKLPLVGKDLRNREAFSRWVYKLHEVVNNMLHKKSGLKYCDVRERYEHFRSRCTLTAKGARKLKRIQKKTRKAKESGCIEPLYGTKSKCVLQIVPQEKKCKTLNIDKKCIKKKL